MYFGIEDHPTILPWRDRAIYASRIVDNRPIRSNGPDFSRRRHHHGYQLLNGLEYFMELFREMSVPNRKFRQDIHSRPRPIDRTRWHRKARKKSLPKSPNRIRRNKSSSEILGPVLDRSTSRLRSPTDLRLKHGYSQRIGAPYPEVTDGQIEFSRKGIRSPNRPLDFDVEVISDAEENEVLRSADSDFQRQPVDGAKHHGVKPWSKTVGIDKLSPENVTVRVKGETLIEIEGKEDRLYDGADDLVECIHLRKEVEVPAAVDLDRLRVLFRADGTVRLQAPPKEVATEQTPSLVDNIIADLQIDSPVSPLPKGT